jgi:hypothetical protein
MISQLNLSEQSKREKFSVQAEKTYDKAISQAKSVFEKAKIGDMV